MQKHQCIVPVTANLTILATKQLNLQEKGRKIPKLQKDESFQQSSYKNSSPEKT